MKLKRMIAFVLIIALCLSLCACDGEGGSSKNASCKSCGRTYEAGDSAGNYKNIARSGMCNNCYKNFKWAQEALGK